MSDTPRTTYNIEVSERHLQFENTALKNQIEMLKDESAALKKKNAALKKQWYTPVATLLRSGERGGFWVNSDDKRRLAKLPAGTTLFIMIDKP